MRRLKETVNIASVTVLGYRIWILVNWAGMWVMWVRKLSSQPACFVLPRMEPRLGSNRAKFNTSLRSRARMPAQCPFQLRAWSSLKVTSNTHDDAVDFPSGG